MIGLTERAGTDAAKVFDMINVHHLASGDRWGGAESQLLNLMNGLRHIGVSTQACLLNDLETAQRLRDAGHGVSVFDESAMGARDIVSGIRSHLKQHQPDVLHTHRQKENVLGSLARLACHKGVSVRTQHGAAEYSPSMKQRLFVAADWLCGRLFQDAIIAVSEELGAQLANEFSTSRVHCIHNGIDVSAIRAAAEPRPESDSKTRIALVGRLERVKRVDLFIETAGCLVTEYPEQQWEFNIFGDGSLRQALEQQASNSEASTCIHFHGHCTDIHRAIAAQDCLLMCSDHEGLPMTLLEAAALKTRVVAHAVGGIPELIESPEMGTLVHEHSAQAYAEAIVQSLQCEQNAEIAARFTHTGCAQAHLQLYRSLLAVPGKRS